MDPIAVGQLLRTFERGDIRAFEALVARFESPLLRYARAIVADGSLAEDLVQETFLRLARRPPILPPDVQGDPSKEEAVLAAWLHKVTRNGAIEMLRKEKRREGRERATALVDESADHVDAVANRDTATLIESAIENLPGEQREALVLRLLSNRSYREIADIMGKPIGTIGWLISEGLTTLSERLARLAPQAEGTLRKAGMS